MVLLLLFLISSTLRSSNLQKPKPKNMLPACADFFYGTDETLGKIWKMFAGLWDEENLKNNIFSNPSYVTHAFFCPRFFGPPRCTHIKKSYCNKSIIY